MKDELLNLFTFGTAKKGTQAGKVSTLSKQGYDALSKGDYEQALSCCNSRITKRKFHKF
jgi:hypothetical protein